MDSLEKFLLGTIRDAVQQVRIEVMEEMNMQSDRMRLNQRLGVKWNSPGNFKDAKRALLNYLDGSSDPSDPGYRLVRSIYSLLNELSPLFLVARIEALPEDAHEYLPEIDDLVERLRLLYLLQPIYSRGLQGSDPAGEAVMPDTPVRKGVRDGASPGKPPLPGIAGIRAFVQSET